MFGIHRYTLAKSWAPSAFGLNPRPKNPLLAFTSGGSIAHHYRQISTAVAELEPDEGQGQAEAEAKKKRDPEKDRTEVISVETSMEYLKSDAYKQTYGDTPVWVQYRRNFKGQFAPKKTRKTCIRHGMISTGNPCPICRDEYLVLDYRNAELLKQFISPFNGETLHWDKTGVCRRQQFNLLLAIEKAKDYGTISFDVQFREYNYEDYYPKELLDKLKADQHQHLDSRQQKTES